eukprot:1338196-Amorphochlora_amoeboformis.AAC.1
MRLICVGAEQSSSVCEWRQFNINKPNLFTNTANRQDTPSMGSSSFGSVRACSPLLTLFFPILRCKRRFPRTHLAWR